jgi:cytochrome c oxidase assembly factor CtaG
MVVWVWHASAPYQATLESDLVHAAEHLSLLAVALFFWQAVLVPDTAGRGLRPGRLRGGDAGDEPGTGGTPIPADTELPAE